MRKRDMIVGGLVWAALALLMPVVALEPVRAVVSHMSPEGGFRAAPSCADGSASLIMGCASIHL